MSLRKIKRNMAHKQLEAEGRRQVNKVDKHPNIYGIQRLSSDFSHDWQTAVVRRVNHFAALNQQKKARAK
jgi:hypothetical protein